ncbi:MAG: FAD-dependent oxidoreductase [Candidatus Krumholzibacteriota bacterium]|nr:FAD-dependent oxidoreductase [Candidatus Krumholzibacteriota bacterium]
MEKIRIIINGREVEAVPGKTILEVVREYQIDDIPTLCHSEELEPYGSCFLCVVEVKGRNNLVPACATRISPGMEIETRNERVIASRKTALELLLSNHYADCVSPCMEGCPAGVDAQGYIALSAMGQYARAVDLIRETNPLPAICGRVCVRKCEVVCRRIDIDAAVGINAIKRFVTDQPGVYDGQPEREAETGKSVGIVGAGPAGLTAAWFLGKKGHKPVIYEAQPRSGGMLRYGIPVYRLPDDVIDAEVAHILKAGGEIRYNTSVGSDISIDELMKKHDAVFLGTGAWAGKPMRVEGEFETEGIETGAEFLPRMNEDPQPITGTIVVVGGGNTAMDVARLSWRLGADKVIVLYRRTRDEMPADRMEIEECLEESIEIMELAAPVGIISENGKLKALRCLRMKLGEPDESGRRRPVPMEGSEFDLPCQTAISAIGQAPVLDGVSTVAGRELELTKWNTVVTDNETMKTNIEGLFAGGDNADDGPTVVIDAVRDGQRAAKAIDAFLRGEEMARKPFIVRKEFWSKPGRLELGDIKESPRHEVHMSDVESRKGNLDEVATGFEFEDNTHECDRCLSCGCVRYYDCDLRLYGEEYGVDMERFKGQVRKHKVDERHPYIIYDPNKCVLCARCIRTCARVLPISAIGLVGRGFKTEVRPAMNDPLVETSCVSCGNCVDSCPTGALTVKYPFNGRAALESDTVETHCGFCSLACPIKVRKVSDTRYYIEPSGKAGDYLCRYGRFGHELFIKKGRITAPRVRKGESPDRVTIEEAAGKIVSGMRKAAEKYGADKTGVFVSPELTNEEIYLAGRIAREGIGTGNISSLSVLGSNRPDGVLDRSFGFTASTADSGCIGDADLIICNNTSLESDHLILAVDVIEAVRKGAKLIVSNSTLDTTDQLLAEQTIDPMRGRSSVLFNGIIQQMLDDGLIGGGSLDSIPGSKEFLDSMDFDPHTVAELTGVDTETIKKITTIITTANNVVIIHSPDRQQDQSSGDMEALANLVVLLRSAGKKADLLLPRIISNSAALEVLGADPAFMPGRKRIEPSLSKTHCREELLGLLEKGELKAALVIGEDPLAWNQTAAWFHNIEFLAAMDWTATETVEYADVVLPGSTYLETSGHRCDYLGNLVEYSQAVRPPSGSSGIDILSTLAGEFGISIKKEIGIEIDELVKESLGSMKPYYWNTGEKKSQINGLRLVPVDRELKKVVILPPLTHGARYKKEVREVGTERFRVKI